jgi:hypothetical protein
MKKVALEQTMKSKIILCLALVLSGGLFGWPNVLRAQTNSNSEYQLELSLRVTPELGSQTLEIFVKNISTNEVKIASKLALAQQWSVYLWFKWQIDGKEPLFGESIPGFFKIKETWLIPPGGEIRWAKIQHWYYCFGDGRWFDDSKLHTVTILPSDRWGNLKVKRATITILGRDAKP